MALGIQIRLLPIVTGELLRNDPFVTPMNSLRSNLCT